MSPSGKDGAYSLRETNRHSTVECPLCGKHVALSKIQSHADWCARRTEEQGTTRRRNNSRTSPKQKSSQKTGGSKASSSKGVVVKVKKNPSSQRKKKPAVAKIAGSSSSSRKINNVAALPKPHHAFHEAPIDAERTEVCGFTIVAQELPEAIHSKVKSAEAKLSDLQRSTPEPPPAELAHSSNIGVEGVLALAGTAAQAANPAPKRKTAVKKKTKKLVLVAKANTQKRKNSTKRTTAAAKARSRPSTKALTGKKKTGSKAAPRAARNNKAVEAASKLLGISSSMVSEILNSANQGKKLADGIVKGITKSRQADMEKKKREDELKFRAGFRAGMEATNAKIASGLKRFVEEKVKQRESQMKDKGRLQKLKRKIANARKKAEEQKRLQKSGAMHAAGNMFAVEHGPLNAKLSYGTSALSTKSAAVSNAATVELETALSSTPADALKKKPTKQLATDFIKTVAERYGHNNMLIAEFLSVLRAFKAKQVTTEFVMQRMAQLFSGDYSLLMAFDGFLPKGYSMMNLIGKQVAAVSAAGGVNSRVAIGGEPRRMAAYIGAQPINVTKRKRGRPPSAKTILKRQAEQAKKRAKGLRINGTHGTAPPAAQVPVRGLPSQIPFRVPQPNMMLVPPGMMPGLPPRGPWLPGAMGIPMRMGMPVTPYHRMPYLNNTTSEVEHKFVPGYAPISGYTGTIVPPYLREVSNGCGPMPYVLPAGTRHPGANATAAVGDPAKSGPAPMGAPTTLPTGVFRPASSVPQAQSALGAKNAAHVFIDKVHRTLKGKPELYKRFLNCILGKKTKKETLDEMGEIFKDYPNLLHEFGAYLPPEENTTNSQQATRVL